MGNESSSHRGSSRHNYNDNDTITSAMTDDRSVLEQKSSRRKGSGSSPTSFLIDSLCGSNFFEGDENEGSSKKSSRRRYKGRNYSEDSDDYSDEETVGDDDTYDSRRRSSSSRKSSSRRSSSHRDSRDKKKSSSSRKEKLDSDSMSQDFSPRSADSVSVSGESPGASPKRKSVTPSSHEKKKNDATATPVEVPPDLAAADSLEIEHVHNGIITTNPVSSSLDPVQSPAANSNVDGAVVPPTTTLGKPLASSFAKRCYFTKSGIGKSTQHYEGLTLTGNTVLMLATAMKLKGCPTICDEDLRRVETTFPNQFSRLPDELLLSSGWRRVSKYCHFSSRPIPDGVPFFHSKERIHPQTGGYYFLLASAIGMARPTDIEPISMETLILLQTDYPNQCDAAPPKLIEDPGNWTLVNKFCFFSGGPINTEEDVYYEADFDGNTIYMLAFLSPSLTPEELYRLNDITGENAFKTVAAVEEVEEVYNLTDRDFDDLKLYHLGPCRALPSYVLSPTAWKKVLPLHFQECRDKALARAYEFEVHAQEAVAAATKFNGAAGTAGNGMAGPQQQQQPPQQGYVEFGGHKMQQHQQLAMQQYPQGHAADGGYYPGMENGGKMVGSPQMGPPSPTQSTYHDPNQLAQAQQYLANHQQQGNLVNSPDSIQQEMHRQVMEEGAILGRSHQPMDEAIAEIAATGSAISNAVLDNDDDHDNDNMQQSGPVGNSDSSFHQLQPQSQQSVTEMSEVGTKPDPSGVTMSDTLIVQTDPPEMEYDDPKTPDIASPVAMTDNTMYDPFQTDSPERKHNEGDRIIQHADSASYTEATNYDINDVLQPHTPERTPNEASFRSPEDSPQVESPSPMIPDIFGGPVYSPQASPTRSDYHESDVSEQQSVQDEFPQDYSQQQMPPSPLNQIQSPVSDAPSSPNKLISPFTVSEPEFSPPPLDESPYQSPDRSPVKPSPSPYTSPMRSQAKPSTARKQLSPALQNSPRRFGGSLRKLPNQSPVDASPPNVSALTMSSPTGKPSGPSSPPPQSSPSPTQRSVKSTPTNEETSSGFSYSKSNAMKGAQQLLKQNRQKRLELLAMRRKKENEKTPNSFSPNANEESSFSGGESTNENISPQNGTSRSRQNSPSRYDSPLKDRSPSFQHASHLPVSPQSSPNRMKKVENKEEVAGDDSSVESNPSSCWTDDTSTAERNSRRALILQMAKNRMKSKKRLSSPKPTDEDGNAFSPTVGGLD